MKLTFNLQVVCIKGLAFDGMVESVYLTGDDGEFEVLAYHHPLIASLPKGDLRIANHASIPITAGVLTFRNNQCRVIAEVDTIYNDYKQLWDI